jgi:FKBP-type peptidyl-prolyl cis-trans isomerase (trigger factor)
MAAHHRLLEEMTVELVMQRRSEELGLSISAIELEAAVDRIKNDYPPGVFEQTLLESALSFEVWKRRLRSRLLLEKLADRELREQVSVTAEEVAEYYDQHYRGGAAAAESEAQFQQLKETVVADLRQKKIEDALAAWMGSLKRKYPVEINRPLWDKLLRPPAADAAPPESLKPAGT